MPKATDTLTPPAAALTSGKAALAMLEINDQLTKLAARVPADHPDTALIKLCADHPGVSTAAAKQGDMETADTDPYWQAYFRSCDAIHDAVPSTIEGMVAKAWAAKVESTCRDGSEDPNNCPAELWSWDLLHDLIRLHAAPNPDAELIALCQEFIDLEQRRDELVKQGAGPNDAATNTIQAQQEALAKQIEATSFKTMEGARMIARAAACWAKDVIEDGFAELGGLHGDLYFTLVKGLIGEARS